MLDCEYAQPQEPFQGAHKMYKVLSGNFLNGKGRKPARKGA
jgi:hypothetical protein